MLLNEAAVQLQIANKAGTISSLLNSNLGRLKKFSEIKKEVEGGNGGVEGKAITKCNQAKHWDFPQQGEEKKRESRQTIFTAAEMKGRRDGELLSASFR